MSEFDKLIQQGSTENKNKIHNLCKHLMLTYDIHHFSYIIVSRDKQQSFRVITNEPETMQKYFNSKMFSADLIKLELNHNTYAKIGEYVKFSSPHYQLVDNKILQKLFGNTLEDLGVTQSLKLINTTSNEYHIALFGSRTQSHGYIEFLLDKLEDLRTFSKIFYSKLHNAFTALNAYAIDTTSFREISTISPILELAGVAPTLSALKETLALYDRTSKLQQQRNQEDGLTPIFRKFKVHQLSKREIDCLKFYSLGKSAKEIAGELYLSKRTVENHLYNARKKLNLKDNIQFYRFLTEVREADEICL